MRIVVATTRDDPLAGVFWEAYYHAGGLSPSAVCFLLPQRRRAFWRRAIEGLILFGPAGSMKWWRLTHRTSRGLIKNPQLVFHGVDKFHVLRSLNGGVGLLTLKEEAPELLVSVGSPEIFRRSVLRAATVGAVNVHNGRLPLYRGVFGTFWEALRGEDWGYTSIHVMDRQIDSGSVLAQCAVRLSGRALMEVLVAKKRLGGRLLAWLVRFVEREGELPAACPYSVDGMGSYYSWPSLRETALLGLRRLGNSPGRPLQMNRPDDTWPREMAVADDPA